MALSVNDQIKQLNEARNLVLNDPTFYPAIVEGILPIVSGPVSAKELRRWGSGFLSDAFSTPMVDLTTKQTMALKVLDAVHFLINESEPGILKNTIQCSSSIYPLVFRYMYVFTLCTRRKYQIEYFAYCLIFFPFRCSNRNASQVWEKMASIKSRILKLWDHESETIRIACIKFVQRVILVQTPGATDPRVCIIDSRLEYSSFPHRLMNHAKILTFLFFFHDIQLVDRSEVSLTIVPLNHPLIPHPALEAEAQGLLDRLLSILQTDTL